MRIGCWISILLITSFNTLKAQQDTLSITLPEAEVLFIKNNIQLLAQKYSIDSAKAAIITAKLYVNPELDILSGFYEPATKRFFDNSNNNREIAFQLSQLIYTAGKRNKNIAVAKTSATITEYQFFDLLRTLQFTLRNDFYNIYYLEETQKAYNTEINSLEKTAAAFSEEVKKGNIAQKDWLRIQSQQYTLQAELVSLQNNIDDIQSEFKLLIRAKANLYVIPLRDSDKKQQISIINIPFQSLVDSAYNNRYDLKASRINVTLNQQNLALQKSLAVPDITLNLNYDRLGSYVQDYNSIGIGIPIPIFNHNQGAIRQARTGVQSSQLQLQGAQDVIESQIANAYLGAVRAEKLLNSFDPAFEQNFNKLIEEVTKNFEKHNLSILEFIDFYDSYKQNVVQLNTLKYNRVSALEQLNYTTGTRIFNK